MKTLAFCFVLLIVTNHAVQSQRIVSSLTDTRASLAPKQDLIDSITSLLELQGDGFGTNGPVAGRTWRNRINALSSIMGACMAGGAALLLIASAAYGAVKFYVDDQKAKDKMPAMSSPFEKPKPKVEFEMGPAAVGSCLFVFLFLFATAAIWVVGALTGEISEHVSENRLNLYRNQHGDSDPTSESEFVDKDSASLAEAMDYDIGTLLGVVTTLAFDSLEIAEAHRIYPDEKPLDLIRIARWFLAVLSNISWLLFVVFNKTFYQSLNKLMLMFLAIIMDAYLLVVVLSRGITFAWSHHKAWVIMSFFTLVVSAGMVACVFLTSGYIILATQALFILSFCVVVVMVAFELTDEQIGSKFPNLDLLTKVKELRTTINQKVKKHTAERSKDQKAKAQPTGKKLEVQ